MSDELSLHNGCHVRTLNYQVQTGQRKSDGNLSFFNTGPEPSAPQIERAPIVLRIESVCGMLVRMRHALFIYVTFLVHVASCVK
jgi:hypothetical protein